MLFLDARTSAAMIENGRALAVAQWHWRQLIQLLKYMQGVECLIRILNWFHALPIAPCNSTRVPEIVYVCVCDSIKSMKDLLVDANFQRHQLFDQ